MDRPPGSAAGFPAEWQWLGTFQIHLVGEHQLWAFHQTVFVTGELFVDDAVILQRITPVVRSHVNNMQDDTAALDVPQKLVPQALPLAGAFDEPRQIGHDEASSVRDLDDAEVWCDRRKVIVGNLRLGLGDDRK